MTPLYTSTDADAALARTGVIFKHSTRCPVSADAYDEVQRFALANPEVAVHIVDVVTSRPVSQHIAAATRIVHQSPQVLVLLDGEVVWHASHYTITTGALERHVLG